MRAAADAFHFVWKTVTGDVTISADVSILGTGGDPHRKAVLIFRQDLDADSVYADAALHGDGLTSLQAREKKGAATHEVQSRVVTPVKLRLTKRGKYVYMSIARAGEPYHLSAGWMHVPLEGTYYVGLGVCAQNKDAVVKVAFSNVEVKPASEAPPLHSTLETVNVASTDRRAVYTASGRIGAPNWTKDGTTLIFNRDGKIERLVITSGTVEPVETSSLKACGNAHGLSPDGTQLALTCGSRVYVTPVTGGSASQIAKDASWRGWSPDGKKVLISNEAGLHSAEIAGGKHTLIAGNARSGEFSPDGSYIYYDSDRSGTSQIWRVRADGSGDEPVTSDEFQNSRPHLSPDGTRIAFLSAKKPGQKTVR